MLKYCIFQGIFFTKKTLKMKKFLTIPVIFFFLIAVVQAQTAENISKQNFFGIRSGARFCLMNVTDSTVWSVPRLGFSAGVMYRYFFNERFFVSGGYEFYQNSFRDNVNDSYIQESNNSLFFELNLTKSSLSEKFSPFIGIGTAVDFSNYRKTTISGGYIFSSDTTLKKDDYFVPLHFIFGFQKLKGKNLNEFSLAGSRNLYASNKEGIIHSNTLIIKIQYCYFF